MTRGRERPGRVWSALEIGAILALGLAAFAIAEIATARWLERAHELGGAGGAFGRGDEAAVRAAARRGAGYFFGGAALLALGRAVSLRRARRAIGAFLLLPALVGACLLGFALHAATIDTAAGRLAPPTADHFASGFFLGGVAGAIALLLPRDPAELASKLKGVLLVAIIVLFALLAAFGSGPGASDARVNLGPFQPIELIKAAFVVFVAVYLGERAAKLRWQRVRFAGLRFPRPVLTIPAAAVLALVFSALFGIRDLGPTMILAPAFVGLFYLATRSSGFALGALGAMAAGVVALAAKPALAGAGLIGTRVTMWRDPWENALTHGHQLAESLWSAAAGGIFGQGLGGNHAPPPPEAKTDVILALLVEQLGVAGLALYLALLAAIVVSAFAVAARSRTPERGLFAAAVAVLTVSQWAVIHAGTFGLLPLTGVVVPFLSTGRSSLIVFVALVAAVARLAEAGRARARTPELTELAAGAKITAALALAAIAAGGAAAFYHARIAADETSARGVVVELADGTLTQRHNPRLVELARAIPRGAILDRRGAPLAEGGRQGSAEERAYPLGSALGTLLGFPEGEGGCLPWWSLERRLDEELRGFPERPDPPARRVGCHGREPVPSPDLRGLAPLLGLPREERTDALIDVVGDAAERSIALSIDARLQRRASAILAEAAGPPAGAAAAVVLDVDTGEILARAQVPDYDPADDAFRDRVADARGDPALFGPYGPLADKTGLAGVYQAGSVAKVFTALAAAREGRPAAAREGRPRSGGGCALRSEPVYACEEEEDGRPAFSLPAWREPIRDFPGERPHGELDVTRALAVSCNVYFAQLALDLGPEPLVDLARDGLEIGPYDGDGNTRLAPGAPGSRRLAETGFGQGGAWMSPVQAARLAAAAGAGGAHRRCAATMELGARCRERRVLGDAAAAAPVLAGMRAVMEPGGTGSRLDPPEGARVYGKSGTAEAPGFAGEEAHGIAPGEEAPPHAWFVALAEPEGARACRAERAGRVAVAVVLPRGGAGAGGAGPPAMALLEAAGELGYIGRGGRAGN